jgi:hypothetical protein
MTSMPCVTCNKLSQRNYIIRANDGGLQPPADGGASSSLGINEALGFFVAGEQWAGGIVRARVTVRKTSSGTLSFRWQRKRGNLNWFDLSTISNVARIAFDPAQDHYDHNDDCPFYIGPLGEGSHVANNNGAIRSGDFTGSCVFPSGDNEAELEVSFFLVAGDIGNQQGCKLRVVEADGTLFTDGYTTVVQTFARNQIIGGEMVQAAFQVRADDGPENLLPVQGGASYLADLNQNPTIEIGGEGLRGKVQNFRNRYLMQGSLAWDQEVQLVEVYSIDDGVTWLDVPEGPQLVAPVERVPSAYLRQGDDIADGPARLGSGTFLSANAGQVVETKQAFHDYSNGAIETELEFCNRPVPSLIDGEVSIRFRLERVVPPIAEQFNSQASWFLEGYSHDLEITFSKQPAGALDEGIATLLQSKGLGTVGDPSAISGTAIVVGEEQESKRPMIAILPEGGRSDRVLGEFPKFQIFTSSLDYDEARALSESVHQALNQYQGALLGRPVARIQAEFEPIPLGRGTDGVQGGRHRFAQTFEVITRAFRPA